jgi:hypothetical protein
MSEWFYVKDGGQQGPVTAQQLQDLFSSKVIDSETFVWKGTMSEWKPAKDVTEVASLLATSPVPATTPPSILPPSTTTFVAGPGKIDVGSIFSEALTLFKTDWLNLSIVILVYAVVIGVAGIIPLGIGAVVQLGIGGAMLLGLWKIMLAKVDGQTLPINTLFSCFHEWWMSAIVYVAFSLVVVIGFIFLIIPGLIISAGLYFWPALVLDKKVGWFDSLGQSWNLTKGNLVGLVLLMLLTIIICVIGLICLIVGVFPAAALGFIMWSVAYRRLMPKSA